jgi:ABC-type transport system involved in multi-copper enzyme maturation permease subunit
MRFKPDQFWTYFEWLFDQGGLLNGFLLAVVLSVLGFIVGYLVSLARSGPSEGFYAVAKVIREFFRNDLPGTSMRRIGAIGRLAFKEALRRRVLVIVAIFVVIIMFAGWFLDTRSTNPARLYISFVVTATNYMVLLLGLFLSTFSLPAEIKSRTIYTIVTKPVRPTEIFIGRVVGFGAVGTVVLLVLGLLSYVFVVRGLRHEHESKSFSDTEMVGKTTFDRSHDHTFKLSADGVGVTSEENGHRHKVERVVENGQEKIVFGPPEGELGARIPMFGQLKFTGADGNEGSGVSVGYESDYHQWIEGASLMSAIWTFDNVNESNFPNGLQLEMSLGAFRTYKGDIVTGVRGTIVLRNPDPESTVESDRIPFVVQEYQLDRRQIPRSVKGTKDNQSVELDLFKDLAPKGKLQVIIRCEDSGQYFGMAAADVSLRAGEMPFWWNFTKGYISIWLQMMIVICFGVMFSTFLSGPVAIVATLSCLVLGFFGSLATQVISKKMEGGGPIEAVIRIVTQQGVMTELDLGNAVLVRVIQSTDAGIMRSLQLLTSALPNFNDLGTSDFLAYGVNLFGGLLSRHITMTLGYFVVTCMVSYFFLKTREMAA